MSLIRSKRGAAESMTLPLMLLSFVMIGGFLYWLSVTAEPTQVAIVEEEPENEDYPSDPDFKQRFGPRGVIKSSADGPIEDTGPLTRKRMETIDEETVAAAIDFRLSANGMMCCSGVLQQ